MSAKLGESPRLCSNYRDLPETCSIQGASASVFPIRLPALERRRATSTAPTSVRCRATAPRVLLAKSVWACSPKGGYTVTLSQRSYCKKTKLSRPFSNRPGGLCFYRPRLVRADSDCLSIFPANQFGMSGQGRQAFDPASPSPAAAVSSWRGQEARRGLRLRRRFFRRGRR